MELVGRVRMEGTVGLQGETQAPTIYPGGMGGRGAHCCSHLEPWDPGTLEGFRFHFYLEDGVFSLLNHNGVPWARL